MQTISFNAFNYKVRVLLQGCPEVKADEKVILAMWTKRRTPAETATRLINA